MSIRVGDEFDIARIQNRWLFERPHSSKTFCAVRTKRELSSTLFPMHELDIIPTLVGGLGAALLFGYATQRLGMSPIVGYLLAGIVIGPNSPGFTADAAIANQFAEVGIVLLMFGVGLHFDLDELMRVRRIALPGALWQCTLSILLGTMLCLGFGWNAIPSIIFGIAVAFASTVVVTRLLADVNELQTQTGNVAIGWLIVQDLWQSWC